MSGLAASELVRWRGVARRYEGGVPIDALHPTSWRLDVGEFVAIAGPSGSGKSTLLNVLGLLDRPTAGTYQLLGRDVGEFSELDRVAARAAVFGFVFQAFHLMRGRTLLDNVELGMLYQSSNRRQRRSRALHVLDQVGLGGRAVSFPEELSGGEAQRVAIARAIAARPRVLLCDEPTGNLDSATASGILGLIEGLHGDGTAVVVVTHDEAVAERADRTLRVSDGFVC